MINYSKYVVITPVRDEGEHIEKTLKSMISQSMPPQEWIIVDDGSTDDTIQKINKYVNCFSWMKVIQLPNRGFRQAGG